MKTIVQPINPPARVRNSLVHSLWRRCFVLLLLGLSFVLVPTARAVDPPPDGGYPNQNTAEGEDALFSLTTDGTNDTAVGFHALFNDTYGGYNTALGSTALSSNIIGYFNTAIGWGALASNLFNQNTAVGTSALSANLYGGGNTAIGWIALSGNTNGDDNTAVGVNALHNNTTGSNNIALGISAGTYLTTGSNNIDIAALGGSGESNTIRLGKYGVQNRTFIAGVSGSTVPAGVTVVVDSFGHMGTITSSARFKEEIKPMKEASEPILALQPVTFRYKKELDPNGIPQFGLVAEQVDKVNPDLVARDDQGKPYSVRYEAINAMLLNEFLKEHEKVSMLEETLNAERRSFEARQGRLEKQTAQQEIDIRKLESAVERLSATP